MANQEQLSILKQGVEVWNKWREENPTVKVELLNADLYESNLNYANLNGVSLSRADLESAHLSNAHLIEARLIGADLSFAKLLGADLSRADLSRADLSGAKLSGTLKESNLSEAKLIEADLGGADLSGADLSGADLSGANLSDTHLFGANLSKTRLGRTNFTGIHLSKANGLESTIHVGPSHISTDTIRLSEGEIPEVFLRGCGLNDLDIEYSKLYKLGLSNQEIININYRIFDLRANQAIQISPLFISYSHADTEFVEKLEPRLTEKGIRFWRDVHEMKAGRLEKQVDHAMRQNPTVILILSENSTRSDWVEHEARLARELEKDLGRDVLCPIALDDSWKSAKWPARLMEQIKEYNILDYSKWQDDKAFGQVFNKLISGLDMFYKPDKESSK